MGAQAAAPLPGMRVRGTVMLTLVWGGQVVEAGGWWSLLQGGFPDQLSGPPRKSLWALRFPLGHAFCTVSHREKHTCPQGAAHPGQDAGGMVVGFVKQTNRLWTERDLMQHCGVWAEGLSNSSDLPGEVSAGLGQRWVPSNREMVPYPWSFWDPGGPTPSLPTPGVRLSQSVASAPRVQLSLVTWRGCWTRVDSW